MKKWTIAFVNYKTSIYFKWQFKILYEFNNPEDFEIIIVDNSRPHEKERLEQLSAKYNQEYNNIKIFYHTPLAETASCQHGEGMNIAVQEANSKYFLAQDPDFFFIKANYLDFLSNFLDKGLVAVGAPYTYGVGLGHPNFPALFGVAHPLDIIKNLDCSAENPNEKGDEYRKLFPNKEYCFDVGYKLREALSNENDDSNFISFIPQDARSLVYQIGNHSYEARTQKYLYNNEEVAYHLFRGAFTGTAKDNKDLNKELTKATLKARYNMGNHFYNLISQSNEVK